MKVGMLISKLTFFFIPLLYLWLFKKHYETSLKIKYSKTVKKIENFSLMLSHFEDFGDLDRDFETDFESLLHENGFTGECKIVKSIYSSNNVWAQVVEEEAEKIEEEIESMKRIEEKYSKISRYEKSIKRLSNKIKKKEKKLTQVQEEIREKQEAASRTCLFANCVYFVTLSSSLSRDKILRSFKDKHTRRCSFRPKKEPKYRISEAADPSNINWKNFGVSWTKVFCARIVSGFILTFSVFFISAVLYALKFAFEEIFSIKHSDSSDTNKPPHSHKLGSLGLYLILEVYQISTQKLTQMLSRYFDVEFFKIQLIYIQGLSLGCLKIFTLISMRKLILIGPKDVLNISFVETAFKVILIQSIMKPIMKVFKWKNVLKFIKMAWIKLRYRFSPLPLLTKKELKTIFTKPKCKLQNLYCEDIYIIMVALISLDDNTGATVACLVYFIVKIFADRILFFWFYADLQIDSIELSKDYFRAFAMLVRFTMLMSLSKGVTIANDPDDFYEVSINVMNLSCLFMILIPYEFLVDRISRKLEKTHLVRRTERREELLEVNGGGKGGGSMGLGSDGGDALLLNGQYYKGSSYKESVTKLSGISSDEASLISNNFTL